MTGPGDVSAMARAVATITGANRTIRAIAPAMSITLFSARAAVERLDVSSKKSGIASVGTLYADVRLSNN